MLTFGKPLRLKRNGKLSRVYYTRIYDDATGKRSWKSTGCRSYQAARHWVRQAELQQAKGPEQVRAEDRAKRAFQEAYFAWLDEKQEKSSSKRHSVLRYQGERYWVPFFGRLRLKEINRDTVREYLRKRKAGTIFTPRANARVRGRPSITTLNNDIVLLRNFFNFCRRCGWIEANPVDGIDRYSGAVRRRVKSLTREEEERLLAACRSGEIVEIRARRNAGGRAGGKSSQQPSTFSKEVPVPLYLAPLVTTALYCGFRKGTLLSLTWKHLDLEHCVWRIPGEITKTSEDYHAPVPKAVVDELRDFRRKLASSPQKVGLSLQNRLGPQSAIFGLSPSSDLPVFRRAVRRAGLEGLTFHDLRRIFVNRLRETGVSLDATMALSAHRSVSTVMKYYREVTQSELQDAVAIIDDIQERGPTAKPQSAKKRQG